VHKLYTQLIH